MICTFWILGSSLSVFSGEIGVIIGPEGEEGFLDAVFFAVIFETEEDASEALDDHGVGGDFDHDTDLLGEVADFFSGLSE